MIRKELARNERRKNRPNPHPPLLNPDSNPPVTEALLRRSYQLEILSLTSQQINAVLDIPVIMRTLVSAALKLTRATGGMAGWMVNRQLVFSEYNDQGELKPVHQVLELGQGIPGIVMQTGQPYCTEDAQADPNLLSGGPASIRSLLNLPIFDREGHFLGCLQVHDKPEPFDEDDICLLQGLTSSAGIALENARILDERLQTELTLRASQGQLAAIIDSAMDAIIIVDSATCITRFNRAAEEMFRCAAAQVIGQPLERLLPKRYRSKHSGWMRDLVRSNSNHRSAGRIGVVTGLRADGEEFPAEISVSMTELHGQISYTAILRDVTERQRSEEDLRAREQHLTVLNTITQTALEAATPEEMLQQMAGRLGESMRADGCHIALWDDRRGPVPVATHGHSAPLLAGLELNPAHRSLVRTILDHGKTLALADVSACPEWIDPTLASHLSLTALLGLPLIAGGQKLGAALITYSDPHPFTSDEISQGEQLAGQIALALTKARLHESLEQALLQSVLALANAIDARDAYTSGHSDRLAELAIAIGHRLQLDAEEQETLRLAARLHDIGKIGVPDAVLRKKGPLTADEWQIMRQHPLIGADIIRPLQRLHRAVPIVRHHQEHYDGSGYPDGLAGNAIPLGARIIAVVDAYSAMIDDRVYRRARPPEQALEEIRRCSGSQFDPQIVDLFLALAPDMLRTAN